MGLCPLHRGAVAKFSSDRDTAYQQLFIAFTADRKLNYVVSSWSPEDREAWAGLNAEFNNRYPVTASSV